jgi:hypothetical protein
MIEQMSFDYKASPGGSFLRDALRFRGWVTARMLMPLVDRTDRELRAEAEASQGEIVTGNKGYCLLDEAGDDEAEHAAARLESQARKMIARADNIRSRLMRRAA